MKKLLRLTPVFLLFIFISFPIESRADSAVSVGFGFDYSLVIHGTPQEHTSFQPMEFTLVGKYRFGRLLALRAAVGLQYNTGISSTYQKMSTINPVLDFGAELHILKQGTFFDPYFFVETGYPNPINGGFGFYVTTSELVSLFFEAQVGMQDWIEVGQLNSIRDEKGFLVGGRVGILFHF